MNGGLQGRVFREPDGYRIGALWVLFGLMFFGLFLFSGRELFVLPVTGILFFLMAVPEVLPRERTYVAGIIRTIYVIFAVTAIPYALSLY